MADEEDTEHFPDVSQKLSAPKKLSAFERDRQAAEAKRLRAEAENAAALKEFEDAFAYEEDERERESRNARDAPTGPRGGGGMRGSRGGNGMPPRSGPGSLGSAGMPPPPSLKRKRALEEAREAAEARREQGVFGFADEGDYARRASQEIVREEDEKEDTTPKPTVQLSSIPPGTSVDELKALLGSMLRVHSVRLTPPAGPGAVGKKSLTAIATLDSGTSANEIDTAVSALRDRYMGCGFYLSITRHLSSAAQFPGVTGMGGSKSFEPFGAQMNRGSQGRGSMRYAPPPDKKGFAPPEFYERQTPMQRAASAQVEVHPPLDIATIRAVHTITDRILSEKSPDRALEMEALLMTLPEVQKDERFAFLYDSKSPAGVYYRFCLWGPDSIDEQKRQARGPERIFNDMDMDWLPPHKELPFPDLVSLAQVTEHIDYDSSDEESDDDGDERRMKDGPDGENPAQRAEKTRLTPLQRARFTRLLARLPTSIARLRQGDISRVTNYVINHAGGGAEDFVDLLLLNIEKPFSSTQAAKYDSSDSEQDRDGDEDEYEPDDALPTVEAKATPPAADSKRDEDPSNAKLIALYTISDVLSASSTAGARNAWKYRQLFEAGLRSQKTFERLGRLDRELGWGRLKADQWKRKIGVVFGIWESWSAFSSEVHAELKQSFFEPPLTEEEKLAVEKEAEKEALKAQEGKWMSKFKKVGEGSASPAVAPVSVPQASDGADDVDGAPLPDASAAAEDDVDGAPLDEVDGAPMEGVDGASIEVPIASAEAKPLGGLDGATDKRQAAPPMKGGFSLSRGPKVAVAPKKRMKAEDMFGDSDED